MNMVCRIAFKEETKTSCCPSLIALWVALNKLAKSDMVTATPFWYKSERPMVKNFVERYMKEYKEIPPMHVAFAYDGMMLIYDAAKRANTTKDRGALRNALGNTKDLELLCGEKVTYKDRGDAVKLPTWVLHKDGAFVEFK